MRLLDTNVIIDVFMAGKRDGDWSTAAYAAAVRHGAVGCNLVIFAELSAKAERPDDLLDLLSQFEIEMVEMTIEGAFEAGRAFADYRRRGGARTTILPDFLIAGHAVSIGAALVTRDRRLGSYFPTLVLITPETDHD